MDVSKVNLATSEVPVAIVDGQVPPLPPLAVDKQDNNMERFEIDRGKIAGTFKLAQNLSRELGNQGLSTERLCDQIKAMARELKKGDFRIGVIGRFRIGKSTFLNVFLGGRILKEQEAGGGCTTIVTRIVRGGKFSAELVYNSAAEMYDILLNTFLKAGITPEIHDARVKNISEREILFNKEFRQKNINLLNNKKKALAEEVIRRKSLIDSALHILTRWEEFEQYLGKHKVVSREDYFTLSSDRTQAPFIKEARLKTPFKGLPDNVVLIDTPGLGAPNWDENITLQYLQDCHAAIHLLLPPAGFEAIDADLLTHLKRKQPNILDKMIFCINRSDEASTHARDEILAHVKQELEKQGISGQPILFICSKFPFTAHLKTIGEKLSPAEQEYMEYAAFKFKVSHDDSLTGEEVLRVSGFDKLKGSLNKLLVTGRARAILQKGFSDLQATGEEIKSHFQSQAALVERGKGGKFKLIERIDEALDMVQYERRRAEKEIKIEIRTLQSRVQKWITPFLEQPEKQKTGLFKDISLFLKHTKDELDRIKAKEEARKRGEIVPEDGLFEFFGVPVTIRGFRDEIDLAALRVSQFIDDFWSMENLKRIRSEIETTQQEPVNNNSSQLSTNGFGNPHLSDLALTEMRDLFLPQLSGHSRKLLAVPIIGVHQDIEIIYQGACDKMQSRISGLTEELILKLNNILNITFKPVSLETVGKSLNEIFETFDRLKNLGKARGVWENMVEWFAVNFKNDSNDSCIIDEKRLERIREDLKNHLNEQLFFPIVQDVASYVMKVLGNLEGVLNKELDTRMEEIYSHAIVEKFGSTRKQIKENIQKSLERQPKIEELKLQQGLKLEEAIQNLEQELRHYLN